MKTRIRVATSIYNNLKGIFCVYKPANMSPQAVTASLQGMIARELNRYPLNSKQAEVFSRCQTESRTALLLNQCFVRAELGHRSEGTELLADPQSETRTVGARDGSRSGLTDNSMTDHELPSLYEDEGRITGLSKNNSPLNMNASDVQFHPMVLANMWKGEDIEIIPVDNNLCTRGSGVLPYAVGKQGKKDLPFIQHSNPIRVYRVTATLGIATKDFTDTGRVLERANHRHVTLPTIDRVLAAIQASHQTQQFAMAGLDLHTQEAYEVASRGLLRPAYYPGGTRTVIYSIRSVQWTPPNLILEIHTVNESWKSLAKLVHDIGVDLRCGAVCSKVRRIRFGHFDLTHSLVQQQWNCENIITNLKSCQPPTALSLLDMAEQVSTLESSGEPAVIKS